MSSPLETPGVSPIQRRNPVPRPNPIPDFRVPALLQPLALKRAASSTVANTSGATHTCAPGDNTGFCQKYVGASTETLPIVLGVVIPIVGALVVLIFLHRRHVRKLRQEDANDAHKSLDFGIVEPPRNEKPSKKGGRGTRGKQNVPEMSFNEAKEQVRRGRGLSMDMDTANPYLLPLGLEGSRESLHSLSRSIDGGDDKYRTPTFYPNDGSHSYPASLRSPGDDSSSFTGSSRRRFDGSSSKTLLKDAHPMSRSSPQSRDQSVSNTARKPLVPTKNSNLAPAAADTARDSYVSTVSSVGPNAALRASNNYLGAFIRGGGFPEDKEGVKSEKQLPSPKPEVSPRVEPESQIPQPPPKAATKDDISNKRRSFHQPPRIDRSSIDQVSHIDHIPNHYPNTPQQTPSERETQLPPPNLAQTPALTQDFHLPAINLNDHQYHEEQQHQPMQHSEYPQTRESQLPTPAAFDVASTEQHPDLADGADDYEYDYYDYEDDIEYDPHRLTMMGERPLPPDDPTESKEQRANRIRSFYKEYFDETKPIQKSPQGYYDGSENYTYDGYDVDQYYDQDAYPSRAPSRFTGPEGRHRATISAGSFASGPRAYSSASGRYGPQPRRGPPKKKLPPPKALHTLPTPHMLKDDTFLPIDFAPPASIRGQRSGTPDSLRGELRPYAPPRRTHTPLTSSFDDLSMMPSPHALRKSGTFTGLDFAPRPRFAKGDSASDAGSVRSGRSNMSAAQLHSIRTGAYRVSRIPKEVGGTKDELAQSLRPKWDMGR